MKTRTISLLVIAAVVLCAPLASATEYTGYFEPFDETGIYASATFGNKIYPTVGPWYSMSCVNPCDQGPGGNPSGVLLSINIGVGHTNNFDSLPQPPNDGDWSVQVTYVLNVGSSNGFSLEMANAAGGFAQIIVSGSNWQMNGCGSPVNVPRSGATQLTGYIILSYVKATTTTTIQTNLGGCSQTCATACNTASFKITEAGAEPATPGTHSYMDNLIYVAGDGHTFNTTTLVPAAEFDQGFKDFASGLGFKTPESKTFFSLIIIGITEICMAFFTGFFGDGKWRLWAIHGVAGAVGVICVLLGYMQFWILLVALVLATTVVNGGRETLNTFKSLAKAGLQLARSRLGARAIDMETGAAVDFEGEAGMTEIEGSAAEVEAEAPETPEPQLPEEEETSSTSLTPSVQDDKDEGL